MLELNNSQRNEIMCYIESFQSSQNDLTQLKSFLTQYQGFKFTPLILGKLFECINPPNPNGFTKEITIDELVIYHPSFRTSNGGDWCRDDISYLGKKYSIKRNKENGRIYSVKLDGKNKGLKINQQIRKDILDSISKQRCAILDISKVEVDHKNGKKDESYMNNLADQKLSDFQPLSKAANDAKRAHCKKCIETGKRYDAKQLGYSQSFTMGDFDTDSCQGCYWYDPKAFNEEISKDFKKLY